MKMCSHSSAWEGELLPVVSVLAPLVAAIRGECQWGPGMWGVGVSGPQGKMLCGGHWVLKLASCWSYLGPGCSWDSL